MQISSNVNRVTKSKERFAFTVFKYKPSRQRWAILFIAIFSGTVLSFPLSLPSLAADNTGGIGTSLPSDDEALARNYAPKIWLDHGESYYPSNVEPFLANTHVETHPSSSNSRQQFLVTNEALGCDSCTNPSFLDGSRPDQGLVSSYAEVVHRTENGQETGITDLIYWTFYPYNNGKRICIGWYSSWGCIGGYSTFGNHVGDWEHVTVRIVDGKPSQIYLSQHSGGQTFPYGSGDVVLAGGHPVVYAARGSHGLYPDARRHTYQDLPNGDSLYDDTSAGILWNTQQGLKIFAWQPVGTFMGEWSWLNFAGRWGNPKSNCAISEPIAGECVLDDGPFGPPEKETFDPHMQAIN
ncbi:Vps62-related protein [Streptomyces sp. NPDC055085]